LNCPECLKQDVSFPGEVLSVSSTIGAPEVFTDEGLTHLHDPTVTIFGYRCAMNHQWSRIEQRTCWCGWRAP